MTTIKTSWNPVARANIVEVGNLAACSAGAARALIGFMTRHLLQRGLVRVTFAATRTLLNSFGRLRLMPLHRRQGWVGCARAGEGSAQGF
jgi:hypothetical protein